MKISNQLSITLLCIATLSGFGCARSAPMLTPRTMITAPHSIEQIGTAILKAGTKRDWTMSRFAPGVIDGHLVIRQKHTIAVRINYNISDYTISYLNSTNLKYRNGKIHRNYNHWINTLDKAIQQQINLIID